MRGCGPQLGERAVRPEGGQHPRAADDLRGRLLAVEHRGLHELVLADLRQRGRAGHDERQVLGDVGPGDDDVLLRGHGVADGEARPVRLGVGAHADGRRGERGRVPRVRQHRPPAVVLERVVRDCPSVDREGRDAQRADDRARGQDGHRQELEAHQLTPRLAVGQRRGQAQHAVLDRLVHHAAGAPVRARHGQREVGRCAVAVRQRVDDDVRPLAGQRAGGDHLRAQRAPELAQPGR